jgi:hypothetical protein
MPEEGNSGIHTGNITGTGIAVGHGAKATVRGAQDSRAVALEQVDELVTRLLASLADATPQQAGIVASEAVALKNGLRETSPDRTRVGKALNALRAAATWAAPVVDLVGQLAPLVTELLK